MIGKSFDVSLVVSSNVLSLSELASLLDCLPGSGSHDKDEPRSSGSRWEKTVWRQNARDADAPFDVQCAQVLHDMPPQCVELLADGENDITALLDVAVYFGTSYCSLVVPAEVVQALSARRMYFEVTMYPAELGGSKT
jgi:hypothetical protein